MNSRLLKEHLANALDGMDWERRQALAGHGIGRRAEIRAGGIGWARVYQCFYGQFDFPDDGDPRGFDAVVIGAWSSLFEAPGRREGADALCLRDYEAMPDLIDLVAWNPEIPHNWLLYAGLADWLGEQHARNAIWGDEDGAHPDLRLNASPLSWLRTGCEGAVLLHQPNPRRNLEMPLRDRLMGVERVVCDDAEHADAVYASLRKRGPLPKVPKVYRVREPGDGSRKMEDLSARAE